MWFTCIDIGMDLQYNILSGLIIISFSRSKRVNKIICLCTSSDENLFTCKITAMVIDEDEDEEIIFCVFGTLCDQ